MYLRRITYAQDVFKMASEYLLKTRTAWERDYLKGHLQSHGVIIEELDSNPFIEEVIVGVELWSGKVKSGFYTFDDFQMMLKFLQLVWDKNREDHSLFYYFLDEVIDIWSKKNPEGNIERLREVTERAFALSREESLGAMALSEAAYHDGSIIFEQWATESDFLFCIPRRDIYRLAVNIVVDWRLGENIVVDCVKNTLIRKIRRETILWNKEQ
jgi:hypothetical protein